MASLRYKSKTHTGATVHCVLLFMAERRPSHTHSLAVSADGTSGRQFIYVSVLKQPTL